MKYKTNNDGKLECRKCGSLLTTLETNGEYCFMCELKVQAKAKQAQQTVYCESCNVALNASEFAFNDDKICDRCKADEERQEPEEQQETLTDILNDFKADMIRMFKLMNIGDNPQGVRTSQLRMLEKQYPQEFFLLQKLAARNVEARMKAFYERTTK